MSNNLEEEKLKNIGLYVQNIRELFSWSTDEFANRIGASRPTINNLEKYPEKMSKTFALAIFLVATAELERRKKFINQIKKKPEYFKGKNEVLDDLMKWGTSVPTWFTGSVASTISMPFAAGVLGAFAGAVAGAVAGVSAVTAITSLVVKIKNLNDKESVGNNLGPIIAYQETVFSEIENKIQIYFGTTDVCDFVSRMDSQLLPQDVMENSERLKLESKEE